MDKPDLKVLLRPDGRITISGQGLGQLTSRARAAELWHSDPDQGLAIHFLAEAKPGSLALQTDPDQPEMVHLQAGPFLDKVGFARPQTQRSLTVRMVDEDRMVVVLKTS